MGGARWGTLHHSQHHLRPVEMSGAGKSKCVSLKTPIPNKFQGDGHDEGCAPVPEFTSLVNFPLHMTAKQSSLADGMRCCVMCGQACPGSASNKNKKLECTSVRIDDDGDDFSVVSLVKMKKSVFFLQFSHGIPDLCFSLAWCSLEFSILSGRCCFCCEFCCLY